ncbi:hypothetical protein SAMN04487830_11723 [Pseudobutyrivibrio sp. OR37]|uniref:hypothetical protein n=1 Tax=Pseudobutyrivibrio sp. OR37 TaxID=1798186 RepID=UPI0008EE52BC|nr:hypothetical protein [Pseudobutyrivibrio sp. OR37]SFI00228.1 hypothetical protein SAMN04487830_11723 [Pseudobutyrivibrio sp. OR37]
MSQSEDYLDGLLNSINKAKTDAIQVQEKAEKKQQEATESRKAVAYNEDFFEATGINVDEIQTKSSHPYLRQVLSEEDFLRKFEEELESDDVDLFISNFEQEIDDDERHFQETGEVPESDGIVDALLNNKPIVKQDVQKTQEAAEEMPISLDDEIHEEVEEPVEEIEESVSQESSEGPVLEDDDAPLELPDDDDIDLSAFMEESDEDEVEASLEETAEAKEDAGESSEEDDDLGFSLDDMVEDTEEEPLDESLKEFMPDEMDALDEAEFGEGEEPDLSGDGDLDLDNLLEGDEDLLDIQSLLNGDEEGAAEGADIDDSAEGTEGESEAEEADDGGKKKKGKKEKKEKKKKEKGEKKPNPIVQKLLLILFGPPDEDEIAEAEEAARKAAEVTYDEDGNPVVPEDPKEKKKRLKEEKKAAKEAAKKEKEAAKKEKEAAKKDKPPKPPKPKKEKKPKEPDNSPKIPISIIATFLLLSISIIGVVMVGMTFTGLKRHMEQANELFEAGDYIAAYEKLNGFDFKSDEKVELLRNQARTLADLQTCQQQYEAFIAYEQYPYALDALIIGVGRYEKYKDEAAEYGIADQYDAYHTQIVQELNDQFKLSEEDALAIYKQPNRHYYTIELRKVLRGLGLPDL